MSADDGAPAVAQAAAAHWIGRIASGDRAAEAEFVRHYEHGVRVLVRRHCRAGDPAVADLVQEVLVTVLERLRSGALRDPAALPAYVQTTIVHATSREYRSRRCEVPIDAVATLAADNEPARAAADGQLARMLRALAATLPVARDREVLVRFYLDEQDRDQICRELGLDEDHLRRVLFRARARLRELLLAAGIGGP
ncbi:MAG: sigma-70 family RNA polymerase sigma factor [Dokdonella sp.]|uniref:RNA polymerase sigma factor n=1 Tax=Dokdonella sp. TaxID=2291710 RepID=UPI0027BA64F8|nr:sigma-70 family RNA polymerase sigma factor [Dokdonella sp.]MCW5578828.1 sigma-70 family RNA polymerase sigma factor [Dokdonella sp.]